MFIEYTVEPQQLAKVLKAAPLKDSRKFISDLMEQIDCDAYAEVAKFVAANPIDKVAECPRCGRRSYVFDKETRCGSCMALIPMNPVH